MQNNKEYHSRPGYSCADSVTAPDVGGMDPFDIGNRQSATMSSRLDRFTEVQEDVQHMRSALIVLQGNRDQLYHDYMASLSRWRARELRMKNIIDKQRKLIRKMRSLMLSGSHKNEVVYASESPMSSESSSSFYREHVAENLLPVERSFIPPWDIDMDDVRRQLQDIDESICRVEEAKTGLSGRSIPRLPRSREDSTSASRG